MNKDRLRRLYREKRMALPQELCRRKDERLASHLRQIDWSIYTYVHVFLAISRYNEPDLSAFVTWLRDTYPHVRVVISRSNLLEGTMEHFVWDADTVFVENKWGISEPVDGVHVGEQMLDVVFVPLLVADRWGHRVGYGKGFYDRFLIQCRPDVETIGVSYFPLLDERIQVDDWDIPLQQLVTPEGLFDVGV